MNRDQIIRVRTNRAAIILAGGDGTRLAEVTRRADGVHVPKQFCALVGATTMLDQTRKRVSLSVAHDRVAFALNRDHERFFAPLLAGVSLHNVFVQPRNRGTAPAILYSLLHLAESDSQASVLLMPSDHYVGDEPALMKHVDLAFAAVEEVPQRAVLLGITPNEPETAYGWIEPATAPGVVCWKPLPVRRFWEKPSREIVRELMAMGCLWNSFILVGKLQALLGLFVLTMPDLYVMFSKIRPSLGTLVEEQIVARLYERLGPSDFSRQVLQPAAGSLSVLPVSDVGWSDLGEPHRIAKALADLGAQRKDVAA
jgi:mannose-1-phosphate guanylyltransferase